MTLLARGSLVNVYASLDAYLTQVLVTPPPDGPGLTVNLPGVRHFNPPIDDPWVVPYYDFLGLQNQYMHLANATQYVTERQGYLQLNIYQRARIWTQRYLTASARDQVVNAFPDGKIIVIYDYSNLDNPEPDDVGYFHVDGLKEHVQDSGLKSGVIQHIVQVSTRYFEYFTR